MHFNNSVSVTITVGGYNNHHQLTQLSGFVHLAAPSRRNDMTTLRLHNFVEGIEISSALYGLVQRVEAATVTTRKTLATWVSRSKDRRQLAELSDRMLTDIGLTRVDVEVEINKHFWQL
jgi:uncharacterized protein YjiS (DUF1127 family)